MNLETDCPKTEATPLMAAKGRVTAGDTWPYDVKKYLMDGITM